LGRKRRKKKVVWGSTPLPHGRWLLMDMREGGVIESKGKREEKVKYIIIK